MGEREGGAEIEVLKRVSQIEGERGMPLAAPVRGGGVRGGGGGLEMVRSGSVSEKLKMFGGGRTVAKTTSVEEPVTSVTTCEAQL